MEGGGRNRARRGDSGGNTGRRGGIVGGEGNRVRRDEMDRGRGDRDGGRWK